MNNSGPVGSSAGAFFITEDSPAGVNPLMVSLTGEAPSHIRATDPMSAAVAGLQAWYGTPAAPEQAATGSPWFTRVGAIVLGVVLVALGVYFVVRQ